MLSQAADKVPSDYVMLRNICINDTMKDAAESVVFALGFRAEGIEAGKTTLWEMREKFSQHEQFMIPIMPAALKKIVVIIKKEK